MARREEAKEIGLRATCAPDSRARNVWLETQSQAEEWQVYRRKSSNQGHEEGSGREYVIWMVEKEQEAKKQDEKSPTHMVRPKKRGPS